MNKLESSKNKLENSNKLESSKNKLESILKRCSKNRYSNLHEIFQVSSSDIKQYDDTILYLKDVHDISGTLFLKFCYLDKYEHILDINDVLDIIFLKRCCLLDVLYVKKTNIEFIGHTIQKEEKYTLIFMHVKIYDDI